MKSQESLRLIPPESNEIEPQQEEQRQPEGASHFFARSNWAKVWPILCVALLAYFKPGEPFLTQYLVNAKVLSSDQVYQEIYPIWTYAQLALLLTYGVCAEYLSGGKWMVVLGSSSLLLEPVLLVVLTSFAGLQLIEIVSASGAAGMIIFTSFIYRVLPEGFFQRATSFVRAAFILGTVSSSLLGQLLLDQASVPITLLFWIQSCVMVLCLAFAISLPSDFALRPPSPPRSPAAELSALRDLWGSIAALALWLIVSLAVHTLVLTYYQVLFFEINSAANYNGYVQASSYACAALSTLLPGLFYPLVPAYVLFFCYHCLFEFSMTVASYQIALTLHGRFDTVKHSPDSSRVAIVFSWNTIVSIVFQVLLQFIIGKGVLDLTPAQYFVGFGSVLGVLGVVLVCAIVWIQHRHQPVSDQRLISEGETFI